MEDTKLGRYKHYKGNDYQLLCIAKHSETLEEMVVYKALDIEEKVWVRPFYMFFENVVINGIEQPRFKKIS
jgi:hypothetical protein